MSDFNLYAYKSNKTTLDYVYKTLTSRLVELAEEDPSREALVFYSLGMERSSLTRSQLVQKSLNLARNLCQMGFKKGDVVFISMNNTLNLCIAIFGLMFAGLVQFHMSASMKDHKDLLETIQTLDCKLVLL